MDRQRRAVLSLLGAGLGAGTAGCLGRAQEDDRYHPAPDSGTREQLRQVDDDSVSEAEEASAASEAGSAADRLAERTDRIMDELAWFATDYHRALETYVEAGEQAMAVVREVAETVPLTPEDVRRLDGGFDRPAIDRGWPYDYDTAVSWEDDEKLWRYVPIDWRDPDPAAADEPPLSDADLDRLADAAIAFAETFERAWDPHFHGARKEAAFAEEAMEVLERFTDYGDRAMVVAGLLRLYRHYRTMIGPGYVVEHLSNDPIRNRLVEYLGPSHVGSELPALYEVDYVGRRDHAAFAHSRSIDDEHVAALNEAEPTSSIDGATFDDTSVTLQDVVSPLEVHRNRVDAAFVVVNFWVPTGDESRYYPAELEAQGIAVQRFEDETSAESASRRIAAEKGSVVDELTFGDGPDGAWKAFRYEFEGERWYTAVRRVGSHVLIAGPSRRPFEHRPDGIDGRPDVFDDETPEWKAPFVLAWIWSGSLS